MLAVRGGGGGGSGVGEASRKRIIRMKTLVHGTSFLVFWHNF